MKIDEPDNLLNLQISPAACSYATRYYRKQFNKGPLLPEYIVCHAMAF